MMRWSQIGGIALVVIGLLVLLRILLPFPIGGVIVAVVLIGIGVLVIQGATRGASAELPREDASIPLEGATEAVVTLAHGAGRLRVGAGATEGMLASGSFGGGLDAHTSRDGSRLRVEMRVKGRPWSDYVFPWVHGRFHALDWDVRFAREVPISLELETGAGESRVDLGELAVRDLRLKTGASATTLDLPARAGSTRVRVESGMAAVKIRVPAGVAADIRVRAAIAGARVDRSRFPSAEGANHYRSPDFDTAGNRVEIEVDTGVGSIEIV
jgi:predicted membrane protein